MTFEEVESLIALIIFKKSQELKRTFMEKEIAIEMGLSEDYISHQRAKGRFTDKFIRNLKDKYSSIIESEEKVVLSTTDIETVIFGIAARQKVHGHYLAEIFASEKGVSVAKVLIEMEQLEKETAVMMIRAKS